VPDPEWPRERSSIHASVRERRKLRHGETQVPPAAEYLYWVNAEPPGRTIGNWRQYDEGKHGSKNTRLERIAKNSSESVDREIVVGEGNGRNHQSL